MLTDEKKRSIHFNVVDNLLGTIHDYLCQFLLQNLQIISFMKHLQLSGGSSTAASLKIITLD